MTMLDSQWDGTMAQQVLLGVQAGLQDTDLRGELPDDSSISTYEQGWRAGSILRFAVEETPGFSPSHLWSAMMSIIDGWAEQHSEDEDDPA